MLANKIRPSINEIAPFIKDSLADGKKVKLTVTGMSMYPLLRDCTDNVIIDKCELCKKYDVVLYRRPNGRYVFHRILKVKGDSLVIAGDNETVKEYGISTDCCIGKMVAFERFDKMNSTRTWWYVVYSRLWVWFFPLRRPMGKILGALAKLRAYLLKK